MAAPKKRKKQENSGIDFNFSIGILDNFIRLFSSENNLIDLKILNKLDRLIMVSNTSKYNEDLEMYLRIRIIKKLLRIRIDEHLTDPTLYLDYLLDNEYDEEVQDIYIDSYNSKELSNEQVKFIDTYISERIYNAALFKYLPMFTELDHKLKLGNANIKEINEEANYLISDFNRAIKVAKAEIDASANDFTSKKSEVTRITDKVIKNKKEFQYYRTAIKELNKTLKGGFYNSRLYLMLAAPKKGKSTTLLNLALQVKAVNTQIKTKDPTKRPAIVYLTQENTVFETVERLWSYYFSDQPEKELDNYTIEEAIEILNETGFVNDDDNPNLDEDEQRKPVFVIKYRKNRTINANDIESMLTGLAEENLECVILFHDYLKRLAPVNKASDERLEYGNISNELSELCKTLDIPIITAMQLTKRATEVIENKSVNAGKSLNSSFIGESYLIIENIDAAFIVNLTKTKDDKYYMFFKLTEIRYKIPDDALWEFYQPFERGMKMVEDYDLAESRGVESLASDLSDDSSKLALPKLKSKSEVPPQEEQTLFKKSAKYEIDFAEIDDEDDIDDI